MTREDYQKVKDVFQSALELADGDRAAFLDDACPRGTDLRREVERLLNTFDSEFMEGTAVQSVADMVTEAESLISGEVIGRYSIVHRLGKGGMGEVFLAHDRSLGRDVAIKVLLPEFTSDRDHLNRFKLEAKAASALNHPNIITIYEIGEDHDRLFIAAEHIVGETLRSLISSRVLTLSSSITIAEQVATALTAAHKAGIVHRDIKPENIIVREDGLVKILDFGLAKPAAVDKETEKKDLVETMQGVAMGSVNYMSPEQARGQEVDARTDLWSLGVVLYEMLTGTTPFHDGTKSDILANILQKDPAPISERLPDAPAELSRIVKKCLRKESDERYQGAKDLALDLKDLKYEMEVAHEIKRSVSTGKLHKIRPKRDALVRASGSIERNTRELKNTGELRVAGQTGGDITGVRRSIKTAMFAALGVLILAAAGSIGYTYLKPAKAVRPPPVSGQNAYIVDRGLPITNLNYVAGESHSNGGKGTNDRKLFYGDDFRLPTLGERTWRIDSITVWILGARADNDGDLSNDTFLGDRSLGNLSLWVGTDGQQLDRISVAQFATPHSDATNNPNVEATRVQYNDGNGTELDYETVLIPYVPIVRLEFKNLNLVYPAGTLVQFAANTDGRSFSSLHFSNPNQSG